MSAEDKRVHIKSCKLFPKTELIPQLTYRDLGLHHEVIE